MVICTNVCQVENYWLTGQLRHGSKIVLLDKRRLFGLFAAPLKKEIGLKIKLEVFRVFNNCKGSGGEFFFGFQTCFL